jgi:general secretion pathway protein I
MVNRSHQTDGGDHHSGFTLLEVLLALSILATSMTILMGTVATSNQQAMYANRLTQISQLARSKMIDVENEVRQEGFTDNITSMNGDFSDQGAPEVSWEAEIQPVEIPEGVKEDLMGRVNAQLFGGAEQQGSLQGNAAFSSKLPALMGCIPQMINRLGRKVRRVVLVVRFPYGQRTQKLTLSQYIIDQSNAEYNLFGAAEAGQSGLGSQGSGSGSTGSGGTP